MIQDYYIILFFYNWLTYNFNEHNVNGILPCNLGFQTFKYSPDPEAKTDDGFPPLPTARQRDNTCPVWPVIDCTMLAVAQSVTCILQSPAPAVTIKTLPLALPTDEKLSSINKQSRTVPSCIASSVSAPGPSNVQPRPSPSAYLD